jgi:cell wall-associated NlpC family hydrolase
LTAKPCCCLSGFALVVTGVLAILFCQLQPSQAKVRAVRKPAPKTQFERYSVRQGDTLYDLSRRFGTTVTAIKSANGLRSTRLRLGQVLRLPTEAFVGPVEAPKVAVPPVPKVEPQPATRFVEFIEAGDETASWAIDEDKSAGGEALEANSLRTQLLEAATSLLGIRYRRSGVSEKTGFDCSGLVQNVFRRVGIILPRSSREQYREGFEVSREQLEPGDLVFFSPRKTPNHVAIYIGSNQVLHALSGARRVVITSLDKSYFKRRFLGARRIPALWQEAALIAASSTGRD